jgi:hypothetical protein
MNRMTRATGCVLVAVLLSACAPTIRGQASFGGTSLPTTTSAAPGTSSAPPPPPPSPTTPPPPPSPAIHAFGTPVTYENGLTVTVSGPEPYTPSNTAAGEEGFTQFVRLSISVSNGTTEPYEPVLFTTNVQSGVTEGSQVFDYANNLGGSPSTAVLPGRELTWQMGFGVTDVNDLIVEVTPGFDYNETFYSTTPN